MNYQRVNLNQFCEKHQSEIRDCGQCQKVPGNLIDVCEICVNTKTSKRLDENSVTLVCGLPLNLTCGEQFCSNCKDAFEAFPQVQSIDEDDNTSGGIDSPSRNVNVPKTQITFLDRKN